jgi:hypothetical protein
MSNSRIIRLAAVLFAGAAACTEPRTMARGLAPAPELDAHLAWSDSSAAVGSMVTATVQLSGSAASTIASFTARVSFDSTALRFVDETPIADGATRVSNPRPGLLRVAGVSLEGFANTPLYTVRFTVLRRDALATAHVSFDELHTAARTDARVMLGRRVQ